jgi:hypothetical protein
MGSETGVVAVTQAADFVLDGGHVKVPSDTMVGHVPWCVDKLAQGLGLEAFEDLNVGRGGRAPELDSVGPDGFEDGFVEEELIGEGKSRTAPEEPVHLGEDEAELFPFSEDV